MYLSVIIPAYNEEKRIGATLSSVLGFLSGHKYTHEIIVVDDGSTDLTTEVVGKYLGNNLRLVRHEKNLGKGRAVKTGMENASGEMKLFMDADGSTSIKELPKLISFVEDGYDVVISSRRAPGARVLVNQSRVRDFLSRAFGLLVRLLIPLGVYDTQNGFKLFRREVASEIFKRQSIFRWAFDVEILAIARRLGFKIKEVPIEWINSGHSRMTLPGMLNMLFEVLSVRLNLWAGRYR